MDDTNQGFLKSMLLWSKELPEECRKTDSVNYLRHGLFTVYYVSFFCHDKRPPLVFYHRKPSPHFYLQISLTPSTCSLEKCYITFLQVMSTTLTLGIKPTFLDFYDFVHSMGDVSMHLL